MQSQEELIMDVKSYSSKQAGVIYRAYKEGKIEMTREAISEMYDCVGYVEVYNTDDGYRANESIYAIRKAVDAIFAGDYESAQVSINNFMAA